MTDTAQIKTWSMQEFVQVISPIMFGLVGFCFTLGLLIVNLRLAKFGVFDNGFVRTEYVLTGALFLFLVAVAAFSFDYALNEIIDGVANWKAGKRKSAAGWISFSILVYLGTQAFALGVLSQHQLGLLNWKMWVIIGILLGAGFQIRDLFGYSRKICRCLLQPSQVDESENPLRHLNNIGSSLIFVLVFIAMYAQYAYPYLSPAYGGGLRDQVILIPTERGMSVVKTLGLKFQTDQKTVGPLEILTESEKEIIVFSSDDKKDGFKVHAIRLDRSLFDVVINVEIDKGLNQVSKKVRDSAATAPQPTQTEKQMDSPSHRWGQVVQ